MKKVLNTRTKMLGLVMEENDGVMNIIFADGSQKDVKAAVFERHYQVLDENATANDWSVPEGVDAISKEEIDAKKAADAAKKSEGKGKQESTEGKTPEELAAIEAEKAAKKAEKEKAKADAKAAADAKKAEAKAKREADAAAKKAEREAKAAERAAKKQADEAPFEPFPFTYVGSEATKTSKVEKSTAHTFTHDKFTLVLTVEDGSKGISPVKRGCHVQESVTTTEEGKEPVTSLKTLDKCTSITKALGHMGVQEADIARAKRTIAVIIKGEDAVAQEEADASSEGGSEQGEQQSA